MPAGDGFLGRAGRHAARYRALYVLAAAWLAIVAIVPTVPVRPVEPASDLTLPPIAGTGDGGQTVPGPPSSGATPDPGSAEAADGAAAETRAPMQTGASTPGRRAPQESGGSRGTSSSDVPSTAPVPGGVPPAEADGTASGGGAPAGLTRARVQCRPGVRQFDSAYAAPCRAMWTGSNGGATHRGVTADSVKIVLRRYASSPDNVFVEHYLAQGGIASEDVTAPVRRVFAEYFNKTYELYGRQVVFDDYTSNGHFIQEGAGEGREIACADATAIAEDRKAFGVLPAVSGVGPGGNGFAGFADCAVERRLFVPVAGLLNPESWHRRAHPYAWGIQPDCERIARQYAEYVGTRLAGRAARFARDPLYRSTPRVFGLMGPDGGFRECMDLIEAELKDRYGVKIASRYHYGANAGNDPSVLARQAAQAVIQFKSAGVTTLLNFTEALTTANLTSHARSQQWGPEWVIHGVGFDDSDGFARLYDQDRVNGHLFGLSYIGSPSGYLGPKSEPARLYKKLTGKPLPEGTDGDYYALVHMFNLLQSAGPTLTPDAIGAGAGSLPPGGAPHRDLGGWSLRTGPDGAPGLDHTEIDDAREVYWNGDATGSDGKQGTFVATYSGRRFTNGQWPAEDPPIYPAGCTGTCQRAVAPVGFRGGSRRLSPTRRSAVRR